MQQFKKYLKSSFILLAIILPLSGCPMLYYDMLTKKSEPKSCWNTRGSCFEVKIDSQLARRLTADEVKELKARLLPEQTRYTRSTVENLAWKVDAPVSNGMNIEVLPNKDSVENFGDMGTTGQGSLLPLNNQNIQSRGEIVLDPTVRSGGAATVGARRVVDQKSLPPGEYILVVRLSGIQKGWDEKVVYFIVK